MGAVTTTASIGFGLTAMQKLLKFMFATALVLGLASTIVASAHPMHHSDLMRDGHSEKAQPVDTSHWLI
jgi:hypothetical protein